MIFQFGQSVDTQIFWTFSIRLAWIYYLSPGQIKLGFVVYIGYIHDQDYIRI